MPKRRDLLERISADDPNYESVKKSYHQLWADSHGLVADALGGNVTLADFIDSCVNSVDQGARTHVAIQNTTPISARCRELDTMTKKSIRLVSKELLSQSKRLGEATTAAAIAEFSRRVNEIGARSKQQIHERELATSSTQDTGAQPDAVSSEMSKSDHRQQPMVTGGLILEILAKQGIAREHVTYTHLEEALIDYRRSNPNAIFEPDLRSILFFSDFASRNRVLFREKWNEATLLSVNPKEWQDLASQFGDLLDSEAKELRSGWSKGPLMFYGDHVHCRWASNRDDELSHRFDVLASKAGQQLGDSPGIQKAIRHTKAESWADFWKYCLWFYRGEASNNTIADPLKGSVKFCLHLALHSGSDDTRDHHPGKHVEGNSPQSGSYLSDRDAVVHKIVGSDLFQTHTNAEIAKVRSVKKRLREECALEAGDALKACLDRIRRAKSYPLSREIAKKRSAQR